MIKTVHVLTPICIVCKEADVVTVVESDLLRWRNGALVQEAFPEMPAERREQLVSGTHPDCFAKIFGR